MPPYTPSALSSFLPGLMAQQFTPGTLQAFAENGGTPPRNAGASPFGSLARGATLGDVVPDFQGGAQMPGLSPEASMVGRIQPKKKPKFFSKDGAAPLILAAIGDALAQRGGLRGGAVDRIVGAREREEEREFDLQKFSRELEAKREERMSPRVEQVGNTLGMFDPSALSFNPIYSQPQPFEAYATARGFQPGSREYADEVENYRLGSWGDPAMDAKRELEGLRQSGRQTLLGDRLAVTRRGQDMADSRGRRGQDLRAADDAADDRRGRFSSGFGGRDAQSGDGAVAVNKSTGERMILKGGKWVPYQ